MKFKIGNIYKVNYRSIVWLEQKYLDKPVIFEPGTIVLYVGRAKLGSRPYKFFL